MELGYPGTPEAEVLEEPQSEDHENLPNTPSVTAAPKRKNFTLRSALKNVFENIEANQVTIKGLQILMTIWENWFKFKENDWKSNRCVCK